jgi:hypothetical protein
MTQTRDEAALEIGHHLLDDADKLRMFLGSSFEAIFPIAWKGCTYTVTLKLEQNDHETG